MEKNKTIVLPIVIGAFSLVTLYNTIFQGFNLFGIASCIIAAIGIIFYFRNNSQYDKYFKI
jgi:predicted membrane chloride channel (bestrophin family)